MPLVPCPDCGKEVSPRAPTCPQCGAPLQAKPERTPEPSSRPVAVRRVGAYWEGIGFVLIVVGMIGGMVGSWLGWLALPGIIAFLIGRFL